MNEELAPIQFSGLPMDSNSVKKRGFLHALVGDKDSIEARLKDAIELIRKRYEGLSGELYAQLVGQENNLKEHKLRIVEQRADLDEKKKYHVKNVLALKDELEELLKSLETLQSQVNEKLQVLGKEKAEVVTTALLGLEKEILTAISIYRKVQNEQNKELEGEFKRDKTIYDEKIDFWKQIKANYKDEYDGVSDRLKLLSRDGINARLAKFLLYLGGISALVSGWWFCVWSGPGNGGGTNGNIVGNTNVNFFFLDNLGRFLGSFSTFQLFALIIFYLAFGGGLSWVCYLLLSKYGYIQDFDLLIKNAGDSEDVQDDFTLREKKLLQFRIRSNSWWSLSLKLMPLLIWFLPLLGMVNAQVAKDTGSYRSTGSKGLPPTNLQGLFDSLVNEFMGSAIALTFAVFALLFLARVVEHRYHRKDTNNDENPAHKMPVFYIGFILFALMILSMFLYHATTLIGDIRHVAILGFTVSCLATGFSLSYGYIFNGMKKNRDDLLFYLDAITGFIQQLSLPQYVNYTTIKKLRERHNTFGQKMMDLIEGRHNQANNVSASLDIEVVAEQEDENNPDAKVNKAFFHRLAFTFFKKLGRRINRFVFHRGKRNRFDYQVMENAGITDDDLKYFPELSLQLAHLREQIKQVEDRRADIIKQQLDYLENQGTTGSLFQQIRDLDDELLALDQRIVALFCEYALEKARIDERCALEQGLFSEGFLTGVWFRKFNLN